LAIAFLINRHFPIEIVRAASRDSILSYRINEQGLIPEVRA